MSANVYGPGDQAAPAMDAVTVTPSDSTSLRKDNQHARGLYVGTGGTVRLVMRSETATVDFVNVPSGFILPVAADKVYSTGTTASNIVALF